MRRLLALLSAVFILAGVTGATAAQRTFLAPQTFAQALNSQAATASAFAQLRSKAAAAGTVRVIVGLRVPFAADGKLTAMDAGQQRRDIAATGSRLLTALPGVAQRRVRVFDNLPIIALDAGPEDLSRLAADPAVQTMIEDHLNQPLLAQSVPLIRGDAAWAAGYRGLGQTVAILDTGVDKAHPFLYGKVVSEACYSTGGWCPGGSTASTEAGSARPCPFAECNHGTHVAGIAAGRGWKFSGVAKDANILAIQVFSPIGKQPRAYDSDIIAGLYRVYALRNTYNIAAANMSLGHGAFTGPCDDQNPYMAGIIADLRDAGIATVIASGNEFQTDAISAPACILDAVSVGSVSDSAWGSCAGVATAADQVACYSNSAPMLSLLAPGSLITSSVPNRKYADFHGTSMATPHVAGAWAVLKEKSPGASVTALLSALRGTGKPVTDYRNGITKPRIDVMAALDVLSDPRKALAYVRSGTAKGTVSFSPAGTVASCEEDCFNRFATGQKVTLTATPAPGASFYGWGGACTGQGSCVVTMSNAASVYAGFYTGSLLSLSAAKSGSGGGAVKFAASGFNASCSANCTQSYWKNATVWLTAVPDSGSTFKGWSGVCRGMKEYCVIRMGRAKSVTASFERAQ